MKPENLEKAREKLSQYNIIAEQLEYLEEFIENNGIGSCISVRHDNRNFYPIWGEVPVKFLRDQTQKRVLVAKHELIELGLEV